MTRAQRSPVISLAHSLAGATGTGTVTGVREYHRVGLWQRAVSAARSALAAVARPAAYYPPLREGFVEEAAMAREMRRL